MLRLTTKVFLFIAAGISAGCTQKAQPGKELAKKYCSSCHLFPEPSLLDKITWKKSVLPAMGKLLGAQQLDLHPFEESDRILSHQKSFISAEDWKRITNYYTDEAPGKLPQQSRLSIKSITDWFTVEKKLEDKYPANTFVKIDPGNQKIYAAARDSTFQVFNTQLNRLVKDPVGGVLVDMFFTSDLKLPGARKGIFTNIGIMDPNDLQTGSASVFNMDAKAKLLGKTIFDSLRRPVQIIGSDLNADNITDYVVCSFGNKEGSLMWMQTIANGQYTAKILEALPGSIRAQTTDVNGDGLQDIVVLFAQGNEGLRLYLNKGNGNFARIEIMRFPPVYGSTYFEMTDFDGDGREDILYTCGDNADYSSILKYYHGIYIFLNKGGYHFEQAYFFPLHGAFKAIAKDFNKDGKLDIGAISYFPDRKDQPEEAFVILEGQGGLKFISHSIKEHDEGNWITMDAADVDGDGDDDIVIGSLMLPTETAAVEPDVKRPLFLLLRNNTVRK